MKKIIVKKNDADQRADRFLTKLLPNANKNFIMKMIRKKNIIKNDKKLNASDILRLNDEITLFFSDDTFEKFSKKQDKYSHTTLDIVFEDENIIILDKPNGLLSHSAKDLREKNLIDGVLAYLIEKGEYNPREESSFVPALCNRLDRNTSGLVIVGKNANSLKMINKTIRDRNFKKIYNAIVIGDFNFNDRLIDKMVKSSSKNKSFITKSSNGIRMESIVKTIERGDRYSLVEIDLITGRTHQIRLQLSNLGYPILGDPKYGNSKLNTVLDNLNLKNHQLLSSVEMIMPELEGELEYLSNMKFVSKYKEKLREVYKKLNE